MKLAAAEAIKEIRFRDPRPPQEIQFELERDLAALFQPVGSAARLTLHATAKVSTVTYRFELDFEAALLDTNCYRLCTTASWADRPKAEHDACRKSSDRWFGLWTRNFQPALPPGPGENSAERYRILAERALSAEAHLADIAAVQREIVERMRNGARYFTSNKEGGSIIRFDGAEFVRADYGESNRVDRFEDEKLFLVFLREFHDWETSRSFHPERAPEFVAWKLMLRWLRQ